MNGDLVGTLLTGLLGGGVIASTLTYLRDRRRDKADYTVATYQTLASMNDRLKIEVTELQTQLDTERRLRRELEDRVARLERGHDKDAAADG